MCKDILMVDTGEIVSSMGEIRALVPRLEFHLYDGCDPEEVRREGEAMGDEFCLCWVDLEATLAPAGFRVWPNPDVMPTFLCERIVEGQGETPR